MLLSQARLSNTQIPSHLPTFASFSPCILFPWSVAFAHSLAQRLFQCMLEGHAAASNDSTDMMF